MTGAGRRPRYVDASLRGDASDGQRLAADRTASVSAIHRRRRAAERGLHVELLDVQLDRKAAVTETSPLRPPQELAEGTTQVIHQRLDRSSQPVYPSFAIR